MIREKIFPTSEQHDKHGFRIRGHEVQRIETFSDAVFAFAVTLLIVSLEVPKSFDELLISMRGFFAFAICFTLLMMIWHEQHVFFRRYALDDTWTVVLNSMLIFIVLFYVYPLKFLFSLWFGDVVYGSGKNPFSIREGQVPQLFAIYGAGFLIIYSIFFFMYRHVLRRRGHLQLSALEVFDTRTKLYSQLTMMVVGFCAVILALVLPETLADRSGWWYFAIPPAFSILHWRRGVLRKRIKA
ncbi:MAG TPA: TMEM175 family protein [Puia sp.]|nr:TMEM175 family protein [Puia sp.]